MRAEVKITTSIELDIETAARWFAELDDDNQARFFVAVAKHSMAWPQYGRDVQWFRVGSHLKNCECATEEARQIVRDMHDGLVNGTH